FRFGDSELGHLKEMGIVSDSALDWLSGYKFSGSVHAYREGELFFPYSPILTVEASLGDALIVETLVLSTLNYDCAVAAAAARIVQAAQGRPMMEAGARRVRPEAAVGASRAAYIAGVDVSSNLEAGRRWQVPTAGTASHAFTLAFPSERDAFEAQLATLGPDSTYLVDTFDISEGIRAAVEVTEGRLGAIRIDSGDLALESKHARQLLDDLGAHHTRIMVSGDLDEYSIGELADAPIDAYESGHRLVTGSGAPSAGLVYKLVAVADTDDSQAPLRSVFKSAEGKASPGGRKDAHRILVDGTAQEELITVGPHGCVGGEQSGARPLQVQVVHNGSRLAVNSVEEAREHFLRCLGELPAEFRGGDHPGPAIPTRFVSADEE
ncbi:MAG: nicotinate phosphoribosyltransferase, partial [Acidimicrobiales bacterium]